MTRPQFLTKFAVCFIWLPFSAANGIGSTPPGPQLPPLSYTPAERLRGAHLSEANYDITPVRFWTQVEEVPKWGGNVFSISLRTAEDGVALLPGRPLTERLAKDLERYTLVIEWALQHNMHIIFRFVQRSTAGGGPLTWPDDGRSIWKDASAQDELIQSWADLAKRFKGKKGIMFVPITEPHGETPDEFANADALTKAVWNTLYPRLINAIRAEDPERWIIVEPIWGNVDSLAALTVSSAPNLIYSFHFYEPHFFTLQGAVGDWPPAQSVVYPGVTRDASFRPEMFYDKSVLEQRLLVAVNFRNAHNVRVMCGEFGTQNHAPMDSRERWVTDVVDLLETYGFDWLYFSYARVSPALEPGAWTFQRTAYESAITSKFSLNLEYGDFDGNDNLLLAGGVERSGLSRGAAFQLFNSSGALQTTRFALNPDFRSELSFVLGNFDADGAHEVLVGGRETSGLARGPAYQLFETDGTSKFTRFVLSPDFSYVTFSPLNVGSNGVLVCGQEIDGLARGPAYQAFDASGNLLHTRFVLNPDFSLKGCIASNLDGVGGDEVIVWGREVLGLERGLAIEAFGPTGNLLFSNFLSVRSFAEARVSVVDSGAGKNIVIYGREVGVSGRGPGYQTFNSSGNFISTRFVRGLDVTAFQLFGANTTNTISGQEIVTGGLETGGLARGPMYQVWDKNGNLLLSRFVLNPDFTEVTFSKIDINNDGLDEILVVGRETKGLQRGPAFQLFDGGGNLLVAQFELNSDFTNLKVFAVDQNGDGDKEIGIGGIETGGLKRGPAYQIFESNGDLLQTQFVLNDDGVPSTVLVAAVLPGSRSVEVGTPATAFVTIINAGSATAAGVGIVLKPFIPARLTFQTTDPATNAVTGTADTPVDIPAGGSQSFVIALTPHAPIAPTDVEFSFSVTNALPVAKLAGINTLLFSSSAFPVPDIVALAATLTNNGVVNVPGTNGTGAFAVATVNVGATGTITASADTGSATLPVVISLCQTNPATGQCISAIGPSVTTQINANATPTFGIFVQGNGNVPFDPAANRIFVRFKDGGNVTRGSTSVAVRT
jgi:Cellulase (glycosyl hydrolase family 5)